MIRLGFVGLAIAFLLSDNAYATGIVLNGSFESPGFFHSNNNNNYRYLSDTGDVSIAGWTIARTQVVGEKVYWYHSTRYPTFEGEYGLALTDGGRASAFVSLDAHQRYLLHFYSVRDMNPAVGDFGLRVSVGSASETLFPFNATDTGVPGGNGQNWLKYEFAFTSAIAGIRPIEFLNVPDGIASSDGGLALDAVSIMAVPEPGGCVAVLIAGAIVSASRLSKRMKQCSGGLRCMLSTGLQRLS
ncbi:MAG: hypothetical protein NT171_21250 [Planctomycetota bacterium]|nr:hypothetical protein [Planctomycetota bacterium]